jgi:hypothetical protein
MFQAKAVGQATKSKVSHLFPSSPIPPPPNNTGPSEIIDQRMAFAFPHSPQSVFSNTSTLQGIVSPSQMSRFESEDVTMSQAADTSDVSFSNASAASNTPYKFRCAVLFTIFCAEKKQNKNKKTEVKWIGYKQNRDSHIFFDPYKIEWTTFQKMVRIESGHSFSQMPIKIEEGTKANPPTIAWSAYILRNDEWPKSSPGAITNDEDFMSWIDEITATEAKKGGIVLVMENPAHREALAHKEAVLAKSVRAESSRMAASMSRGLYDEVRIVGLTHSLTTCNF